MKMESILEAPMLMDQFSVIRTIKNQSNTY